MSSYEEPGVPHGHLCVRVVVVLCLFVMAAHIRSVYALHAAHAGPHQHSECGSASVRVFLCLLFALVCTVFVVCFSFFGNPNASHLMVGACVESYPWPGAFQRQTGRNLKVNCNKGRLFWKP